MYFTRNQDSSNSFKAISGPLKGPIARNLPDGGSAALEGLVRAVEVSTLLKYMLIPICLRSLLTPAS
jgi:hypothetical protein